MSYTKGPLKVEVWDYSHATPPKRELNLVSPEFCVATLAWDQGQDNPYTIPEAEARANGALFEASHDMLEALEKARAKLAMWPGSENPEFFPEMKAIDKAITKAKGGQA